MEDQEVVDTQAVDLERADEEKTPSEIFGDPPGRCGECEEVDPECMESMFSYPSVSDWKENTRLTASLSKGY